MYLKYLKYKNKYLKLKNQIGGAEKAEKPKKIIKAFNLLENFFNQEENIAMLAHMNKDEELRKLVLGFEEVPAAAVDAVLNVFTDDNTKHNTIIKKIFCAIISKMENKDFNRDCLDIERMNINADTLATISWIIRSYIRMTIPNIATLPKVVRDIAIYGKHRIKDLYGYEPLLEVYDPNKFLRILVGVPPPKQKTKEEKYLDLLKETCILNTDKVTVHIPRTMEESIELGKHTRWCTSTKTIENNKFEKYNKLYIIIPRKPIRVNEKYQLYQNQNQEYDYEDEEKNPILLFYLLERFNNKEFESWLFNTFYFTMTETIFRKLPVKKIILDSNNDSLRLFDSITHLIVSNNEPLQHIPVSLEHLIISQEYNQTLPKISHTHIKELYFNYYYNEKLTDVPESLEILNFGDRYNKTLPEISHTKLKKLYFGNDYNELLQDMPESLEILQFGDRYNTQLPKISHTKLKELYFGNDYDKELPEILPESLEILKFGFKYDTKLPDILPKSLKILEFGHAYNKPLIYLPESLEKLTFGFNYNYPLPEISHTNIKELIFEYKYNYKLPEELPESLEILMFGSKYNNPLPKKLPKSLKKLIFGYKYNYPIPVLPKSLPLKNMILPPSLLSTS